MEKKQRRKVWLFGWRRCRHKGLFALLQACLVQLLTPARALDSAQVSAHLASIGVNLDPNASPLLSFQLSFQSVNVSQKRCNGPFTQQFPAVTAMTSSNGSPLPTNFSPTFYYFRAAPPDSSQMYVDPNVQPTIDLSTTPPTINFPAQADRSPWNFSQLFAVVTQCGVNWCYQILTVQIGMNDPTCFDNQVFLTQTPTLTYQIGQSLSLTLILSPADSFGLCFPSNPPCGSISTTMLDPTSSLTNKGFAFDSGSNALSLSSSDSSLIGQRVSVSFQIELRQGLYVLTSATKSLDVVFGCYSTLTSPSTAAFTNINYTTGSPQQTLTWSQVSQLVTVQRPECFAKYSMELVATPSGGLSLVNTFNPATIYDITDTTPKSINVYAAAGATFSSTSYQFDYKIKLLDQQLAEKATFTVTSAFTVTLVNPTGCGASSGNQIIIDPNFQMYSVQDKNYINVNVDFNTLLSTSMPGCTITFPFSDCKLILSNGSVNTCDIWGGSSSINFVAGRLTIVGNYGVFPVGQNLVTFKVIAGPPGDQVVKQLVFTEVSATICSIFTNDCGWSVSPSTAQLLERRQNEYLRLYTTQTDVVVTPLKDSGSLLFKTPSTCQIYFPLWRKTVKKIAAGSNTETLISQTDSLTTDECQANYVRGQVGEQFIVECLLLSATFFTPPAIPEDGPKGRMIITLLESYPLLQVQSYQQPLAIDLASGSAVVDLFPPLFKDEIGNLNIDLGLTGPVRTEVLRVVGQTTESIADYAVSVTEAVSGTNKIKLTLSKMRLSAINNFSFVICYSYGAYPNLQSLCDTAKPHSVTNTLGICNLPRNPDFWGWKDLSGSGIELQRTQNEYLRPYVSQADILVTPLSANGTPIQLQTIQEGCEVLNPLWRKSIQKFAADSSLLASSQLDSLTTNECQETYVRGQVGEKIIVECILLSGTNFTPAATVLSNPRSRLTITILDSFPLLTVQSYQTPLIADLASGSSVVVLEPPLFTDDVGNVNIDLVFADPARTEVLQVVGQSSDKLLDFAIATTEAVTGTSRIRLTLKKVLLSKVKTFNFVVCYSYGTYANLKNLCNTAKPHIVNNALGVCNVPLGVTLDPDFETKLQQASLKQQVAAAPATIIDLAKIATYKGPVGCPVKLVFSLFDEKYKEIVDLSSAGLLDWKKITDANWVGVHNLTFAVYNDAVDPTDILPLDFTLKLLVEAAPTPLVQSFKPTFARQAPVMVSQETTFTIAGGEDQSILLKFADPLAQAALSGQQLPPNMAIAGLKVRISDNELLSAVQIAFVDSYTPGFAIVKLAISGSAAVKEFESHLMRKTTLAVTDLSQGGLTSNFELSFKLEAEPALPEQELSTIQEQQTLNQTMIDQQLRQKLKMESLLKEALLFSSRGGSEGLGNVTVNATLTAISEVGQATLKFHPPIVMVPNDWDQLWDIEEREKLAPKDRKAFEEALLEIMHVTFVQNTLEKPQRYFMTNITLFTESYVAVNLNFSDPLLVSQGQFNDKVRVRLLRSYFMQPSPLLALQKGFLKAPEPRTLQSRALGSVEYEDEYIIFTEEIPKQLADEEELALLAEIAQASAAALEMSFYISFIVNLLLKSAMSQLWIIFNTLQIILALPKLAVIMPENATFVYKVIQSIVDFSPIDKKALYDSLLKPLLGEEDEEGDMDDTSGDKAIRLQHLSFVTQILFVVCAVLALVVLICLVAVCKIVIAPRCPCAKTLIDAIQAKLMLNSVLRSLMQTFLATSIALWTSLRNTSFESTKSKVDFSSALLTLVLFLAFICFSCLFLKRRQDKLREPAFKARFDSLYQNVDYYNRRALPFTGLFLLRRFLFALIIANFGDSIVLQVFAADILSTLLLAFYVCVRPMNDPVQNFIQVLNETVVLIAIQFQFVFTEYVPEPVLRYEFAWYFLYLIGANAVINGLILVYVIVFKIYSAIRLCFLRRRARVLAQKRFARLQKLAEIKQQLDNDPELQLQKSGSSYSQGEGSCSGSELPSHQQNSPSSDHQPQARESFLKSVRPRLEVIKEETFDEQSRSDKAEFKDDEKAAQTVVTQAAAATHEPNLSNRVKNIDCDEDKDTYSKKTEPNEKEMLQKEESQEFDFLKLILTPKSQRNGETEIARILAAPPRQSGTYSLVDEFISQQQRQSRVKVEQKAKVTSELHSNMSVSEMLDQWAEQSNSELEHAQLSLRMAKVAPIDRGVKFDFLFDRGTTEIVDSIDQAFRPVQLKIFKFSQQQPNMVDPKQAGEKES